MLSIEQNELKMLEVPLVELEPYGLTTQTLTHLERAFGLYMWDVLVWTEEQRRCLCPCLRKISWDQFDRAVKLFLEDMGELIC